MNAAEFGTAWLSRDLLSIVTSLVLGFLSAIVLRNLSRTVIAGLLLVGALLIANTLGLGWFESAFLWRTIGQVVTVLPSLKEFMTALLETAANPLLTAGYLVGFLLGLVGLHNLL